LHQVVHSDSPLVPIWKTNVQTALEAIEKHVSVLDDGLSADSRLCDLVSQLSMRVSAAEDRGEMDQANQWNALLLPLGLLFSKLDRHSREWQEICVQYNTIQS
jgi:hypothetical protein